MPAAHNYFSVTCFNEAWRLIEKPQRTPHDNERMLRLSQASLWHWTERPDCSGRNLSIGYWQLSRIYALLGDAEHARRYARLCLDQSHEHGPFFLGYAYEALARAASVAGAPEEMQAQRAVAHRLADSVDNPQDKQSLLDDLASIG